MLSVLAGLITGDNWFTTGAEGGVEGLASLDWPASGYTRAGPKGDNERKTKL